MSGFECTRCGKTAFDRDKKGPICEVCLGKAKAKVEKEARIDRHMKQNREWREKHGRDDEFGG